MKKVISIRALLIALMLVLTFAIPVLVSAKTLAAPIEVVEAAPVEASAETSCIDLSEITPDTIEFTDETSSLKDDIDSAVKEVIEETSVTEIEETSTPAVTTCSYCGNTGHYYSYCAQRSIGNGAVGRWVIPSVGINVAAYTMSSASWCTTSFPQQEICDAPDSAFYSQGEAFGFHFIADHNNQGFNMLRYTNIGDVAYMDYGSYQQKYVCTSYTYGHNDYFHLYDNDWNILPTTFNNGGIVCYTCNGCVANIILVCFQPVFD